MRSAAEINEIVSQSTGTTQYHKFSPFPGYPLATDGVIAVAEAAGCYWLLDVIGSHQCNRKLDPAFQVWTIEVDEIKRSCVVKGFNDTTLIIRQRIEWTDFPLNEFKFFLIDGILLLPSEY